MEIQGYNMPDDLYYEENHYWIRVEGDVLVMGMDDFAQQMAGEIVYVQLPFEGKKLKKGKKFAQVESGKWLGKIFAPVNGELMGLSIISSLKLDKHFHLCSLNFGLSIKAFFHRLVCTTIRGHLPARGSAA